MPPEEISITLEDMKSKKGLSRKSYSVEKTLKDLIDEIGYEGIEAATSKKKSSIQNISNPTYKERQLSHQDAIDLDVYCKKMGLGTPFLTAYATLLKKYTSDKKGHESTEIIINNLLRIGESIGDVMEETRKALNDDKVDEAEKEKIALQVKNLEKKIAELKFKLDLGEKTDYSKVQRRE